MADDLEISQVLKNYGDAMRSFGKSKIALRNALNELVEAIRPVLQQIALAWIDGENWNWCVDGHSDTTASEPDMALKCLAVMGMDGQFRIVVAKKGTSWTAERAIEDATWKEAELLPGLPEFLERYASEVKKKSEINHLWLTEILRQAGMLTIQPKVNLGHGDIP